MKIKQLEVRELFLAFFSMAIFSISNIYCLNMVFFIFWIASLISARGKIIIADSKLLKYVCCYYIWIIMDVIIVTLSRKYPFGVRNLIQIVFEIQYVIWALKIDIKIEKYIDYLIKIALIYSIVLIVAFVITGTFQHMDQIFGVYREWGENLFPGNTTSAPIPFIFALFWCLYYKKGFAKAILITVGGLLFPSRVSLLAVLIVWFFFMYGKMTRKLRMIICVLVGMFIIFIPEIISILSIYLPDLTYRLTLSWDRVDIFKTVYYYAQKHFCMGYGGRTLNQLYSLESYVTSTGSQWPHAHNFIFEELIRYGIIGLIFFVIIIIRLFKIIRDKKIRFIFILFMIMALFQTYMREFDYIFFICIMIYIGCKGDAKNVSV